MARLGPGTQHEERETAAVNDQNAALTAASLHHEYCKVELTTPVEVSAEVKGIQVTRKLVTSPRALRLRTTLGTSRAIQIVSRDRSPQHAPGQAGRIEREN
jgi:hypothetical protein